ncbi:hypothetical protein D9757_006680 [Collybiopsis confluens]|uniref:pyridoxal kinase n=1 Tax=Collybiopsis confluens TaxID=2823264 RepID=A0A8H5HNH4_9AGAR|nr:hypothetical protein D9757_006680 [Collybiopsis confluens]
MTERILSIQSHVAYGYVGGKAAALPLQCLGYDVDLINTVNFSNHAGYGRSGGSKTSAEELESIFQAMESNGFLLDHSRLLTGYIPNAEALGAVKTLAEKLRQKNPGMIYLLDPVMGDAGKLYVSPDVIPVYKSMLSLSTIITPNWFEVETLTSIPLTSLSALQKALTTLHKIYNVPHIAISSIPLADWLSHSLPSSIRPPEDPASKNENGNKYLLCITSSSIHQQGAEGVEGNQLPISDVHAQYVPLIPGYFSGVGDLFSALVLGHYLPFSSSSSSTSTSASASASSPSQSPLTNAVSQALSKTHFILLRTFSHSQSLPEEERQITDDEKDRKDPMRKIKRMRGRELRLVQSIDVIRGDRGGEEGEGKHHHHRDMLPWTGFWENKA